MTELVSRTPLVPPAPPRGQRILAHVIALLTLPSGLWRVAFVIGLPVTAAGGLAMLTTMERIQLVGLSLFVEVLALLALWSLAAVRFVDQVGDGSLDWMWPEAWQKALLVVCYLPLVAWGPLLAALTVGYHLRRGRQHVPIS